MSRNILSLLAFLLIFGILFLGIATSVAAETMEVAISGNGEGFQSNMSVANSQNTSVSQSNNAEISNGVDLEAKTGTNDTSGNGRNESISTGTIENTIQLKTQVNSNDSENCCPIAPLSVDISESVATWDDTSQDNFENSNIGNAYIETGDVSNGTSSKSINLNEPESLTTSLLGNGLNTQTASANEIVWTGTGDIANILEADSNAESNQSSGTNNPVAQASGGSSAYLLAAGFVGISTIAKILGAGHAIFAGMGHPWFFLMALTFGTVLVSLWSLRFSTGVSPPLPRRSASVGGLRYSNLV